MRRGGILLLLLLGLSSVVSASSLQKMGDRIESMERYEVSFSISMEGLTTGGGYRVDGGRYHLVVEDQEIYGDVEERVSVNHTLREVVVESVDDGHSELPILVVNPISTFTHLEELFDVEILESGDGSDITRLKLLPTGDDSFMTHSILEISNETDLPKSISYEVDDEILRVNIDHFTPSNTPLVELSYPRGYEVFDLR